MSLPKDRHDWMAKSKITFTDSELRIETPKMGRGEWTVNNEFARLGFEARRYSTKGGYMSLSESDLKGIFRELPRVLRFWLFCDQSVFPSPAPTDDQFERMMKIAEEIASSME